MIIMRYALTLPLTRTTLSYCLWYSDAFLSTWNLFPHQLGYMIAKVNTADRYNGDKD